MENFLAENPVIAKWAIGLLASIAGALFVSIIGICKFVVGLVRTQLENIGQEMKNIRTVMEKFQTENTTEIGLLKDRVQKQEITCDMQRENCPGCGR